MMRRSHAALLMAAILALPLRGPAATVSNPEQVQIDAYLAVVRGDQARDLADWKASIRFYRDALTFYKRLAEEYAQWHPDIVQYRLTYCANEIASILSRTGRSEAELLAAPDAGPAASANDVQHRIADLSAENDSLHQEIARLNQEVQARPASDSWEADIKRLKDEAAGMQAQLAAMSNQVAQASPKNEDLTASVREENEQLRVALEKAKKTSETLGATLDVSQRELKKAGDLPEQVESLKSERDRLGAEVTKTKGDLDRALQEARAAKDESERLRSGLDKAQKHSAALSETIDLNEAELNKVAELRGRVDSLKGEKDKLAADAKTSKNDLARALDAQLAAKKENEQLQAAVETLKKRADELGATIDSNQKELSHVADLCARIDAMRGEKDKLAADAKKAKDDLGRALDENEQLRAGLEKANKHSEDLGATISSDQAELNKMADLRARMDALKGEKDKLNADLKKANADLAEALQEKRVEELEGLVKDLRAQVRTAQDAADALKDRVSTLEKENAWLERR